MEQESKRVVGDARDAPVSTFAVGPPIGARREVL
jgi:hypothetical protein